jgi:PAS domain S-box-containing protein
MIFINALGRVVYVSRLCEQMMEYSREEFYEPDFNFMKIIVPEYHEKIKENFARHATGEDVEPYEYQLLTRSGRRIHSIINTKLINFHGSKAILGIVTDITALKLAEEERDKIETQLRQAQKMEAIGRLAGGVAHDFNNLLTAITGYSDIILKEIGSNAPLRNDVIEIRKAGERAAALTRQLLAFSRHQPNELKILNINTIVTGMESMLKPIIGEDITLDIDLSPNLARIRCDEGQIGQVLLNLAVNARDAMHTGGRLAIATRDIVIDKYHTRIFPNAKHGKFVCLSVRDTGTGISDEIRTHIFEPFFTTKENGKGTGLGLSVVYGIVNKHGGWINLYTEKNRGTEFKVYLPALDIESATKNKTPGTPLSQLKGNGERILLVEDEDNVRLFAHRLLTENGYTVFSAKTAGEALNLYAQQDGAFDALFSDIVLPDMPGPQLYNSLLEKSPGLKAILTSGYSDERYQISIAGQAKFVFLQKPYLVEELLKNMKKLLSK